MLIYFHLKQPVEVSMCRTDFFAVEQKPLPNMYSAHHELKNLTIKGVLE